MNLRIGFSISAYTQKAIGILIGIAMNLWMTLGSADIFTISNLPTHEHGMSFQIFRPFKILLDTL